MNHYPPYQEDPRYPHQKPPTNQQPPRGTPEWGDSSWGSQQSQPQSNDPYDPAGGYGQYGQYGPPSQRPQSGYGQASEQRQYGHSQYGQHGQYGSPDQYNSSQQGWGYGEPTLPSQYGSNGQYGSNSWYGQYGAPSQQPSYIPNAAPPPYGYPSPGQQNSEYNYSDVSPRKSRKGIYIILAIFAVIIALIVSCGVMASLPNPNKPTPTASIAGTWHGRTNLAANNIGTLAAEAFMNLQQKGTDITGTGKMCINKQGKAFEFMNFIITGSMSGTSVTMTWQFDILTTGAKGTGELTGSLSRDTLSLVEQDPSGNLTLGVKKGSEQQYLAACRQLPGS